MKVLPAILCLLVTAPLALAAGPRGAVSDALGDARRLPAEVSIQTRYLWQPGGHTDGQRAALDVWYNFLSRNSEILKPRFVAPDLLAITVDEPGWDRKVWERLADTEPYFTVRAEEIMEITVQEWWAGGDWQGRYYAPGNYPVKRQQKKVINGPNPKAVDVKEHGELQARTGSVVPVVRADWWLATTSRQLNTRGKDVGVGYYEWLGIRDRNSFFALAGFDPDRKSVV